MRVLSSLPDPRVGGPQLRSLAVAERLRKQGVETVFVLPEGSDAFAEMATAKGFVVWRPRLSRMHPPSEIVANTKYLLSLPSGIVRLQQLIKAERIDLVHANMPTDIQAGIAAERSNAALVWNFDDISMAWPVARTGAFMASQYADEIVVVAQAVNDHYFSDDNRETQTIHAPVDIAKFDPRRVTPDREALAAEIDTNLNYPIIGSVGNLNPIKGHTHLLRAIRRIIDHHGPVTALIAGDIPDTRTEYVRRLKALRAELDLEDSVHFLGRRSDIPKLLATFDVFALPSVAEACPMAVLEAMAMERPVVATRVGGVPEQITDGEHGWVVPPKDPDALAAAICSALDSPAESRQRGVAARKRAKAHFSIERCVDRHMEVYNAALRSST